MMTSARLRDDFRTWLQIGLLSFGGPAGQIALMQRRLVDELGWIDARRFLSGLQFCMLLPGPEAQQLATYIGWTRQGWRGALLAGGLFVLPGAVCMLLLSLAYVHWGNLAAATALLLGLKCAVIALIAQALWRLARRSLHGLGTRLVAVFAFFAVHLLQWPFPAVVLGALVVATLLSWRSPHRPVDVAIEPAAARAGLHIGLACLLAWALPIALLLVLRGGDDVLAGISLVYGELAMLSFGGAYALLTHVADRAVHAQQWLSGAQMADGLALAETTPGPLILVLQFVAFVAAWQSVPGHSTPLALVASLVTLWVLFLPSFAWIFIGAPWIARIEADARFARALGYVSAAAFALILHLGLWMAMQVMFAETQSVRLGPIDYLAPLPASLRIDAAALTLIALLMLGLGRGRLLPLLVVCAGAGLLLASLR